MKNKNLRSILLLSAFLSFGYGSHAQDPSFSVFISNPQGIGKNVFEFDVMVQASGPTSAFELRTFQGGIFVNPAYVNGGTITVQNKTADSELSSPKHNGSVQWNATDNLINLTANIGVKTISSCVSTNVSTAPIRVARLRLENSADFGCTTPDLKFNYVQNGSPLRFRTSVSWRASGCSVNYDMFYPNRPYTGQAYFNGELYSTIDGDGRSPVNTDVNDPGCQAVLNLTAFLEGYYLGGSLMTSTLYDLEQNAILSGPYTPDATDSVLVELYDPGDTYTPVASASTILHNDGTAKVLFASNDISGNPFWVAVKHRNSIQTWSKTALDFTSNISYNFSTGLAQAYDDGFNPPMQDMGNGVFAFYSGDVNQDGTIDLNDMVEIDNNYQLLAFGYDASDCNGDQATDLSDMIIVDNNQLLLLYYAQP